MKAKPTSFGNHIVVEMLVNTIEVQPSDYVWKDDGYTAAPNGYIAQYNNDTWTARIHLPPVHLRCHRCGSFLDVVDTNALFYCACLCVPHADRSNATTTVRSSSTWTLTQKRHALAHIAGE